MHCGCNDSLTLRKSAHLHGSTITCLTPLNNKATNVVKRESLNGARSYLNTYLGKVPVRLKEVQIIEWSSSVK